MTAPDPSGETVAATASLVTDAQAALLRDKYVLWERASREGPMDLRDYNRRAAEALKAALMAVSESHQRVLARENWRDCKICGGVVDLTNAIKPTAHVGPGGKVERQPNPPVDALGQAAPTLSEWKAKT